MKIIPASITSKISPALSALSRYKVLIFVVMVAGVYAYILLTINTLSNAQPSQEVISAKSNPISSARIDTKVINQLRQLEDNSVSVRELFDEARDNPFQE